MKSMFRTSLLTSVFILVGLIGYAQDGEELKIELSPDVLALKVGEEMTVKAKVVNEKGKEIKDREFRFFSSRRRSMSVDSTGLVKAHKHGDFKIIVISPNEDDGYVRGDFDISIEAAAITRVEIDEISNEIYTGTSTPISIKVFDEAGYERDDVSIELVSSNQSVARVDPFHKIMALKAGKSTITASVEGIEGTVNVNVVENPVASIELTSDMIEARTGDVFHLSAKAMDKNGREIPSAPISYTFQGQSYDVSESPSGLINNDGSFVADEAGLYTIYATCGSVASTITLNAEKRDVKRKIELVGQGSVNDRHTSDLWIWEGVDGKDYAVTGTWGSDGTAFFWDVTDPGNIVKIDSVKVDARTVNDVKISEDGKICIISREGASNRKNGMVIIDVSNPRDVSIITEFTQNLTGGVHNLYIYKNHVYALSAGRKYYVVNIEDPANPNIVGEFELGTPGHSIHDVWIEDGIAYSSNWADGIQLVDVGNGIAGGSPSNPVQFASYAYPSGANHAAFPYRDKVTGKFYVIGGDEIFPYGLDPSGRKPGRAAGFLHVVDFTDMENPKEVAWFEVPFAGSHNFWIEDDILYAAFYNGGVRVIDLSGELMGDLNRQGREIAWIVPEDPDGYVANAPFTWGAQPYKGHIFYSDWNSGLWSAKLEPVKPKDSKVETR